MLLKALTDACGVSGFEKEIGKVIFDECQGKADKIDYDALGNVIAFKKGTGKGKKKIMMTGHMDEIGYIVCNITDKGMIKMKSFGGISVFATFLRKLKFKSGEIGIVYSGENMQAATGNHANMIYVDVGAKTKEEAMTKVSVGDYACYVNDYTELMNGKVSAKALDDRIGCYIMLEAMKRIETPYNDLYFVFTVQEEVGVRGAKTAANRVKPDIGLNLDVCTDFSQPGAGEGPTVTGAGPAIMICDRSVICDEYLIDEMIKTAKENEIKYQIEIADSGGTDVSAVNTSNDGVKSCGISVPTSFFHTPCGMLDMSDVNLSIDLLVKYLARKFDI
jgi:putative aminopeptidase FrvX